jgi:hypothetical protein
MTQEEAYKRFAALETAVTAVVDRLYSYEEKSRLAYTLQAAFNDLEEALFHFAELHSFGSIIISTLDIG